MTLLTPALAIAGLCAVAIPILIHLLMRQRRKPIEFAAMRFLIEAFRKHKRRLQLEQMILLATRCLILALLGFALARPLLQGASMIESGGARTVTIVIDNGLASAALGEDQRPSLGRHLDEAVEIVRNLASGDTVSVISAARPAKALLSPPSSDHAAVINLLQGMEPRQSPSDIAGAMAFVREAASTAREGSRAGVVYLLSDFREGSARLDSPLPVTQADVVGTDVRLLASPAASAPVTNVQITSIEPVRSLVLANANDGSGQVKVRLARHGGELGADVTRVRLAGEGVQSVEPRTVRWQPGQSEADAEFMLDFGLSVDRKIALTATIDDDALNADNTRQTILDLRSQLRVLLIDRRSFGFERDIDQLTAGQWIRRALEPMVEASGPITIAEAEPAALDVADLRTADVAFAPRPDLINEAGWRLLRNFIDRGGMLVVMPPAEVTVHQWTTLFSAELGLPWRIALEPVDHAEGLAMAVEQPASEMLRLISSDLPEMSRAVLTYRVLPVEVNAESSAARSTTENTEATENAKPGSTAGAGAQSLLRYADGSAMLVMGAPASSESASPDAANRPTSAGNRDLTSPGLILYLTTAPEVVWTNLPTKPLMVPLVHEIVRQGMSLIRASQKAQVGDQPALAQAGPAARDLRGPDGRRIPIVRGRPQEPLETSGVYAITDASDQDIGLLAVNVDAAAGSTGVQSAAAVNAWLGKSGPWSNFDVDDLKATLGGAAGGSPIAGILLAVVLGLIILETLLARWFSHAYRAEAGGDQLAIRPSVGATA